MGGYTVASSPEAFGDESDGSSSANNVEDEQLEHTINEFSRNDTSNG